MSTISIKLRDSNSERGFRLEPRSNIVVADLAKRLLKHLKMVSPGDEELRPLFHDGLPSVIIYDPYKGLLDPRKTLQQNRVEPETILRYWPKIVPVNERYALTAIKLANNQPLAAVGLLVTILWQDVCYPVILPQSITFLQEREPPLLHQIVFEQVNSLADSEVLPVASLADDWHFYNWRTKETLTKDEERPLATFMRSGDLLKLQIGEPPMPEEEIVTIVTDENERDLVDDIVLLTSDDENDEVAAHIEIETNASEETAVPPPAEEIESVEVKIGRSRLQLVCGDITTQTTDAIVNAANMDLAGGGGVDGAIHQAAGRELVHASQALAPCQPGNAVLTPGYQLSAKWVIHAVGPIYSGGNQEEARRLRDAYTNSLRIASNSRFRSLAFPSISTGAYGYPLDQAAEISLKTVAQILRAANHTLLVRFVLFTETDYQVYRNALQQHVANENQV